VYEVGASELAVAIDMLLNHQTLTVQDADVVALALQQFQAKPALGFSDCLVLEVARKAGHLPLGTFDRGLGKLEGAERI
jgi:predicted nucleic-acid-binding protein